MATTLVRAPITIVSQRVTRFHGARSPMVNLLAVVILTGLLATLYMTASARGTATTYRINDLQSQQAQLERSNAELRVKVSQAQSLDRVAKEATTKLNMTPLDPNQVVYLTGEPGGAPKTGAPKSPSAR